MQGPASLLGKAATRLSKARPPLSLGATAAFLSAHRWASSASGAGASGSGQAEGGAPGGGAGRAAAPGAAAADLEELGDLRPDMTLSEEELDEAEHYAMRSRVHRRRLRPQPPEQHLDEEDPPGEEAPGEEAYAEVGPLLPRESEEEDIFSDEELAARKY